MKGKIMAKSVVKKVQYVDLTNSRFQTIEFDTMLGKGVEPVTKQIDNSVDNKRDNISKTKGGV
jgi:hypothetical protein